MTLLQEFSVWTGRGRDCLSVNHQGLGRSILRLDGRTARSPVNIRLGTRGEVVVEDGEGDV